MALTPTNPTQLTPPRVSLIDERTGAISREWYRFFLSLLSATQDNSDSSDSAPDTLSLLASYDAMLADLAQEVQAAPDAASAISSLDDKVNDLSQTFGVIPPPLFGTVTSVDVSGGATGLTFSGGPITTSGTIVMAGTLGVGSGGTGLTATPTNGQLLIGNGTNYTLSALTAGTAISIANAAGSITITNTLPDQIVSLTGAGTTVITGTYPSFTIASNDAFVGTVTSVNLTAGTGISVSGGPITTAGSITVTNTAPDQIVSLTGAGTTSISGTYPNFTITSNDAYVGTVTSVGGTGTVNGITLTGTVTASGSLTLGGTLSGVSLTTQVTGTLPVGNGGTGATTLSSGYLVKGNGTSAASASVVYDDGTNVGIGTTSLSTGYVGTTGNTLTFKNTSSVTFQNASNSWNATTAGGAITYWSDNNLYIDAKDSASNMIFRVNGATERMRINSSGNVLVNTTTASAASLNHNFEVNGDIMSSGGGAGYFWANRSAAPSAGANWYGWYTTGGTIYLYNPAAGNIASINASTGAYTALSDAAKKTDFEASDIGLDAVLGLKPTLFRMETDGVDAPKQLGFIAQEVRDYIPQAYVEEQNTDASGAEATYIGLNDRPMIAALVKAVQELSARVAQLEGE